MWAMMEKLRIWLRSVTDANYFTKLDWIPESWGAERMAGILAYLPLIKKRQRIAGVFAIKTLGLFDNHRSEYRAILAIETDRLGLILR